MARLHQNNFATNLTSNQIAGVTTTPLNDIPSIAAPFYLAFDATNLNGNYEVVDCTSKTATNVLHAATTYAHTTAEEVRMIVPAVELDAYSAAIESPTGWNSISATLTYSSADAPTYVCTTSSDLTGSIGVGMRIKLTHSASTKYFIVTAIDASTITLYGGTDYTLAATAITAPYYANVKAPLGFPQDPTKWIQRIATTSQQSGSLDGTNWLNIGTTNSQLSIPIGAWVVRYRVSFIIDRTTAGTDSILRTTLSTANNTESNADLTCAQRHNNPGSNEIDVFGSSFTAQDDISLAAKTTYYLNAKADAAGTGYFNNNSDCGNTIIEARCAYL